MTKGAEYQELQMDAITPLEAVLEGTLAMQEEAYPTVYYWLWLAQLLGPASANAGRLLDAFGDAKTIYEARHTDGFARLASKGVTARVANKCINPDACAVHLAQCDASNIQILTFGDADYPLALACIPDPPVVLYATGNLAALGAKAMVGMVGTRRPSAYGVDAAARFGGEFARNGAVIISGLADGLDAESHRAAITHGAVTIGVMGTPITKTFPASNASLRKQMEALGGLTLSEYPPAFPTGKTKSTFLQRNRIIAALSDALVVIEAREKSGTMSTVGHAERYEKQIFAVPGSVFSNLSEGTNLLLREGRAKMLLQSGDVLGALGLMPTQRKEQTPAPTLSPNAKKVLACVGATPTGMLEITSKSGLSMGAALSVLQDLEMDGLIISLPGRQYILK